MITSSNSSEKLDFSDRDDDDDYNDNFHSSMPPPDHSKHTYLTAEERSELYGPREPSTKPSSSSPGNL